MTHYRTTLPGHFLSCEPEMDMPLQIPRSHGIAKYVMSWKKQELGLLIVQYRQVRWKLLQGRGVPTFSYPPLALHGPSAGLVGLVAGFLHTGPHHLPPPPSAACVRWESGFRQAPGHSQLLCPWPSHPHGFTDDHTLPGTPLGVFDLLSWRTAFLDNSGAMT